MLQAAASRENPIPCSPLCPVDTERCVTSHVSTPSPAPSLPMKSHSGESLMYRFHHAVSGLTSVVTAAKLDQRWEAPFLPFSKQKENTHVNVMLINYN